MRVAFSGTHRAGKTTLLEAVAELMPGYAVIEEPYRALEDEGYEFSDPPSRDDFERQLKHCIRAIAEAPADALIDRCPLDFVAYLQALDDDFEVEDWLDALRDSVASLDLIVVVPIESPDRIAVASHEDRRLRRRVDELLCPLILDDPHGFGAVTIEVSGRLEDRVRQVQRAMKLA
jgi:predicted ATPase